MTLSSRFCLTVKMRKEKRTETRTKEKKSQRALVGLNGGWVLRGRVKGILNLSFSSALGVNMNLHLHAKMAFLTVFREYNFSDFCYGSEDIAKRI